MKKFLISVAFVLAAAPSFAETVNARITDVEPRYQTVYQNVPRTQCQNVEVPISVQNDQQQQALMQQQQQMAQQQEQEAMAQQQEEQQLQTV